MTPLSILEFGSKEDVVDERRQVVRVEIEENVCLQLHIKDILFCVACCEMEARRYRGKAG